MSIEFVDAKRSNVPLLILLAGGTGAGKTESALRLATGMSGGNAFAVVDTERGRALHKADDYSFKHADLEEPFTPERYAEAVKSADAAGFPVVVIDSGSHEYEGIGGVLEIQAEEFERLGGRDSARMSSWIEPKRRHKLFVRELLRARAHVILCLRAEDKIEVVKKDGKTVVRPKESLIGAQGWIPICEKRLPFEATISLLLTADAPGVPKPIKLEGRHQGMIPLDRPLDEHVGRRLAEWAAGGEAPVSPSRAAAQRDVSEGLSVAELKARLAEHGIDRDAVQAAGQELFPGRSAGSLSNAERASLLEALLPVGPGGGEGWDGFGAAEPEIQDAAGETLHPSPVEPSVGGSGMLAEQEPSAMSDASSAAPTFDDGDGQGSFYAQAAERAQRGRRP